MADLIVYDEEIRYAKRCIIAYGKALITIMNNYTSGLETILDTAIKDDLISEELRNLIEKVNAIKPDVSESVEKAGHSCENYIQAIDAADQFLY